MSRERLAVGTFGEIGYLPAPGGRVIARARYRDWDGRTRQVQATAASEALAERALKVKLSTRSSFQPTTTMLTPDRFASGWRRRHYRLPVRVVPGSGVQHPYQARQRGDAAHGRSGVATTALLLQRDRRWHPRDRVDIGHSRLIDQTAGVRCHRFEIASLGLGIQRPERQRGLSRAGHSGEHDRRIARHREVDILQIVFAGAENANVGLHGERRRHDPRGFTHARMLVAEDRTVGRGEPAGEGQRVPTEATVPRRSTTQLSSVSALSRSSHAPSASTRTRVIAATMCAVQAVARAATDAASRSGRAASTPRCIAAASSSR